MPISRYEREEEQMAGPRFSRAIVRLYLVAAGIGLLIGAIWVVAGLLNFHVFR
jgi:hypothetical protein